MKVLVIFTFHDDLNDEYFRQLTAEKIITKVTPGDLRQRIFQKIRPRNEALDCFVYAIVSICDIEY